MSIFLIILALGWEGHTHSGRTNSSGCHNNRKTGGYHCHNGGSRVSSQNNSYTQKRSYQVKQSSNKKEDLSRSTSSVSSCTLRKLLTKTESIFNIKQKITRLKEKTIFFDDVETKCGLKQKLKLELYLLERNSI